LLTGVFAGVHTQMDEDAGQQLGGSVARFVLDNGPLGAAHAKRGSHSRRTRHQSRAHGSHTRRSGT
jgi:hypothetical protein